MVHKKCRHNVCVNVNRLNCRSRSLSDVQNYTVRSHYLAIIRELHFSRLGKWLERCSSCKISAFLGVGTWLTMLTTWRGLTAAGRRQTRVLCFLSLGCNISSPWSRVCGCLKVWVGHQHELNVLNILSVNSTVYYFIKHTETETVATSHWQILLNQKLDYSWEGYTTLQLRVPCSVSRCISQSLTSYSDHISSVCSRSRTHYSPECDWELRWA